MTKTEIAAGALVIATCTFCRLHGQTAQTTHSEQAQTATIPAKPLAFQVVSVKPAPPGSFPLVPAFVRDKSARILGLQRMAAPVWMTVGYAYQMQMSEALDAFRKQPDWVRNQVYTETFRAEGEPTREQVREMMRTMLAERFGLQAHEFTREGTVNKLVMSKPGVVGPNVKPHPQGAVCSTQDNLSVGKAPDASAPPVANCGFVWYNLPGGVLHVGMTDATLVSAVRALVGMGVHELDTRPIVDATEMTGKYDITLEFRPQVGSLLVDPEANDGVPSLIGAMKEQLGIRVESGQGTVRVVVIDHISKPTPD